MSASVAIIGAGIIGITNALVLLENGFNVTIFTKDAPLNTNSDSAVATWYAPDDSKPYLQQLCFASLSKFMELSKQQCSGVSMINVIHFFTNLDVFHKSCWAKPACQQLLSLGKMPIDFIANTDFPEAIPSQLPLIDVNIYRPFMLDKFYLQKGKLVMDTVLSLPELGNDYEIIINCAGWETKFLTNDPDAYPIRGQVEVTKINKKTFGSYSLNVSELHAYLVFRRQSEDLILGTTHQPHNYNCQPNDIDRLHIIDKLKSFVPEVSKLKTFSKVGIRCGRSEVRIEEETIHNKHGKQVLLLHCYGHGGSGFSASWGSADEVLKHCLSRFS